VLDDGPELWEVAGDVVSGLSVVGLPVVGLAVVGEIEVGEEEAGLATIGAASRATVTATGCDEGARPQCSAWVAPCRPERMAAAA